MDVREKLVELMIEAKKADTEDAPFSVGKGAFACLECREIGDGECSMQCGERCLEWLQQPAEGG